MTQYYLAKNTFMSESAGHAVFLDLRSGRYLALPPESLDMLRSSLAGNDDSALVQDAHSTAADLLTELQGEGLLVRDVTKGKLLSPPELDPPQRSMRLDEDAGAAATWSYKASFLFSLALAYTMLSLLPLKFIVARARMRKQRAIRRGLPPAGEDEVRRICSYIHPRYFAADNKCLRNSLILTEFLALYRIYPDWIFGVRVQPFSAHSWIQYGPVVLNDSVHHVRTFTPLMVI